MDILDTGNELLGPGVILDTGKGVVGPLGPIGHGKTNMYTISYQLILQDPKLLSLFT